MKGDTIISYFDTTSIHPRGATQPAAQSPAPGGGVAAHGNAAKADPGGATPAPAADSQPQVKTVVAKVKARAFYQMAPRDKTQVRPALNYVRGRIITIDLVNRQVRMVTVIDSAAGVYLEPQSDTVKKDSLRHARILADTLPKYLRKKKRKAGASPDSGGPAPADSASPAQPAPSDSASHPSQSSMSPPAIPVPAAPPVPGTAPLSATAVAYRARRPVFVDGGGAP